MRLVLAASLLALPLVAACDNSCQKICNRMARYAEDCGLRVGDGDVADCKANLRDESREVRSFCRDFNSSSAISSDWTCDDVAFYWNVEPPATE